MNEKATWTVLVEDDNEQTERMRVPGGWLHRTVVWSDDSAPAVALAFQPEAAQ